MKNADLLTDADRRETVRTDAVETMTALNAADILAETVVTMRRTVTDVTDAADVSEEMNVTDVLEEKSVTTAKFLRTEKAVTDAAKTVLNRKTNTGIVAENPKIFVWTAATWADAWEEETVKWRKSDENHGNHQRKTQYP